MKSDPERPGWSWEALVPPDLAETVLRFGTHVLLVALILLFAWGLRRFYLNAELLNLAGLSLGAVTPAPAATVIALPMAHLPDSQIADDAAWPGVSRRPRLHTDLPSRPRQDVFVYVVREGDTLFGIAEKFGLLPETILWANQLTLGDNPHSLRPGQELNILPVNGAYHRWSAGDELNGVARFYNISPDVIVNFPGNRLDTDTLGDWSNPNIEPGSWLVIPGGRRQYVSWSAPVIPLDDPGVAKVLGPGACESVPPGMNGSSTFIWPADHHYLSGFDYEPEANHPAIDIDGSEGSPVYAADSGVVVYAGWNDWGYGNVVVINHGNGWQSLYAHLSSYIPSCGMSVFQGALIGTIGSTGNSTAPNLHFELMYNGAPADPHDYIK